MIPVKSQWFILNPSSLKISKGFGYMWYYPQIVLNGGSLGFAPLLRDNGGFISLMSDFLWIQSIFQVALPYVNIHPDTCTHRHAVQKSPSCPQVIKEYLWVRFNSGCHPDWRNHNLEPITADMYYVWVDLGAAAEVVRTATELLRCLHNYEFDPWMKWSSEIDLCCIVLLICNFMLTSATFTSCETPSWKRQEAWGLSSSHWGAAVLLMWPFIPWILMTPPEFNGKLTMSKCIFWRVCF